MKIRRVKFVDHEVLGNLDLDFTDQATGRAAETVVLAGENGCGKTVILEELYAAIATPSPASDKKMEIILELDGETSKEIQTKLGKVFPGPGRTAKVTIGEGQRNTWGNHRFDVVDSLGNHFSDSASIYYANDQNRNPFRIFLSEAGVTFSADPLTSITATNLDVMTSSRRGGASLAKEISQLLVDIRAADNEDLAVLVEQHGSASSESGLGSRRMDRFRDAIAYMFPKKKLATVVRDGKNHVVQFTENGKKSSLSKLSTGEKQIVFRGGFILRDLASMQGSVVLIDEPELSLHPDWQSKIIGFYRRLLPVSKNTETQLIFATHSPFIVHNNDYAKVVVLKKDNDSGLIQIERDPEYPITGTARLINCFNIEAAIGSSASNVIVLVEGATDKELIEIAWDKLYPNQSIFFDLNVAFGHNAIKNALSDDRSFLKNPSKLVVGIFDFDRAFTSWNGLWHKEGRLSEYGLEDCLVKRHPTAQGWALLLPVPDFRAELASETMGDESALTIEFLFKDGDHLPDMVEKFPLPSVGAFRPRVRDNRKSDFVAHVRTLPVESFIAFKPIFTMLRAIADSGALTATR